MMSNKNLRDKFSNLSTPLIADACLRIDIPLRLAPAGIRSISPGQRLAGRVLPVRHYGSVDIFLEAMQSVTPGDILVIDNGGRLDESCIGDLTALEAQACGIQGIAIWGAHRDTEELQQIGMLVFSYAAYPAGPTRLDARQPECLISARFGDFLVGKADAIFGDADGVLFVPFECSEEILTTADSIWQRERQQAEAVKAGTTLREQFQFSEYLGQRAKDPDYTFRQHLRKLGGAIEE